MLIKKNVFILLLFIYLSISSTVLAGNCDGQTCAGGAQVGECAVGVANRICACVKKSSGGYLAKYTDETTGICTGRVGYDDSGKPVGLDNCNPSLVTGSILSGQPCRQCWDGKKQNWECDSLPSSTPIPIRTPTTKPQTTPSEQPATADSNCIKDNSWCGPGTSKSCCSGLACSRNYTCPKLGSITPTTPPSSTNNSCIKEQGWCGPGTSKSCCSRLACSNSICKSTTIKKLGEKIPIAKDVEQKELETQLATELAVSKEVCSRTCRGTCILDAFNNKYSCSKYSDSNATYTGLTEGSFATNSLTCDAIGAKCCNISVSHSTYTASVPNSYFCKNNYRCSLQSSQGRCVRDYLYEQTLATLNYIENKPANEAQYLFYSNITNLSRTNEALDQVCTEQIMERGIAVEKPCNGTCVYHDASKSFVCVNNFLAENYYLTNNPSQNKGELNQPCNFPFSCNNKNLRCDSSLNKCVLTEEAITRLANDMTYQNLNNTVIADTTGYNLSTTMNLSAYDAQQASVNADLVKYYCIKEREGKTFLANGSCWSCLDSYAQIVRHEDLSLCQNKNLAGILLAGNQCKLANGYCANVNDSGTCPLLTKKNDCGVGFNCCSGLSNTGVGGLNQPCETNIILNVRSYKCSPGLVCEKDPNCHGFNCNDQNKLICRDQFSLAYDQTYSRGEGSDIPLIGNLVASIGTIFGGSAIASADTRAQIVINQVNQCQELAKTNDLIRQRLAENSEYCNQFYNNLDGIAKGQAHIQTLDNLVETTEMENGFIENFYRAGIRLGATVGRNSNIETTENAFYTYAEQQVEIGNMTSNIEQACRENRLSGSQCSPFFLGVGSNIMRASSAVNIGVQTGQFVADIATIGLGDSLLTQAGKKLEETAIAQTERRIIAEFVEKGGQEMAENIAEASLREVAELASKKSFLYRAGEVLLAPDTMAKRAVELKIGGFAPIAFAETVVAAPIILPIQGTIWGISRTAPAMIRAARSLGATDLVARVFPEVANAAQRNIASEIPSEILVRAATNSLPVAQEVVQTVRTSGDNLIGATREIAEEITSATTKTIEPVRIEKVPAKAVEDFNITNLADDVLPPPRSESFIPRAKTPEISLSNSVFRGGELKPTDDGFLIVKTNEDVEIIVTGKNGNFNTTLSYNQKVPLEPGDTVKIGPDVYIVTSEGLNLISPVKPASLPIAIANDIVDPKKPAKIDIIQETAQTTADQTTKQTPVTNIARPVEKIVATTPQTPLTNIKNVFVETVTTIKNTVDEIITRVRAMYSSPLSEAGKIDIPIKQPVNTTMKKPALFGSGTTNRAPLNSGHAGVIQDAVYVNVKKHSISVADGVTGGGKGSAIVAELVARDLTDMLPELIGRFGDNYQNILIELNKTFGFDGTTLTKLNQLKNDLSPVLERKRNNLPISADITKLSELYKIKEVTLLAIIDSPIDILKGSTTVVSAHITGDGKLIVYFVGDTQGFRIRNGAINEIQDVSQKFGNDNQLFAVETPHQIGIKSKPPDGLLTVAEIKPGDKFIFTSDGIKKAFEVAGMDYNKTVNDVLSHAKTAEEAEQRLYHLAVEASKGRFMGEDLADDYSISVIFIPK